MRKAKAPQEPSLPGQALLAPSAGAADLPTCQRAGVAELGCSMLPTGGWGFPPAAATFTSSAAEAHRSILPGARTPGKNQALP